jgi:hypothetical protein
LHHLSHAALFSSLLENAVPENSKKNNAKIPMKKNSLFIDVSLLEKFAYSWLQLLRVFLYGGRIRSRPPYCIFNNVFIEDEAGGRLFFLACEPVVTFIPETKTFYRFVSTSAPKVCIALGASRFIGVAPIIALCFGSFGPFFVFGFSACVPVLATGSSEAY